MLLQETAWWLSLVFLIGDKLVVGIENALVTINSRIVGKPYLTRIMEGLPVIRSKPAVTARIGDYIVRTARKRVLPSATRS
jgi:hypothetical protein